METQDHEESALKPFCWHLFSSSGCDLSCCGKQPARIEERPWLPVEVHSPCSLSVWLEQELQTSSFVLCSTPVFSPFELLGKLWESLPAAHPGDCWTWWWLISPLCKRGVSPQELHQLMRQTSLPCIRAEQIFIEKQIKLFATRASGAQRCH